MLNKYITTILCSLSLFIGPFFASSLEAAHLHVVLVGDSFNDMDPTGFEGGLDLFQREVKKIAAYTDLDLNGVLLEGHHCRIENVLAHIQQLAIEPDDVVILYFAMHGSRTHHKNNPWPDLSFSLDQQKIDFNLFNDIIKEKGPRLFLSIADSCNNFINGEGERPQDSVNLIDSLDQEELEFPLIQNTSTFASLVVKNTPENILLKYRKLFLEQSGTIIISTSSPGEFSIKHCLTGGVFTAQLIETLRKNMPVTNTLSWDAVLSEASHRTYVKVEQIQHELPFPDSKQTPQFELNLYE